MAVANGSDGVAVRDVAGRWHRLGLSSNGGDLSERSAMPLPGAGELVGPEFGTAVLAALLVAVGSAGWLRGSPAGFTISALLLMAGLYVVVNGDDFAGPVTLVVVDADNALGLVRRVAGVLLMVTGGVGMHFVRGSSPRLRDARVLAAVPLGFAAVYLPFLGWSADWFETYGTAVLLASLLSAGTLATAVRLGLRARPTM
ncbi:hypothetical protein Misp01_52810 [Microtetraspora sp. NBRC 13810]|nr:hypothetical protein Misp01_52810 [Microtetraspora sp. NBRC 13810]